MIDGAPSSARSRVRTRSAAVASATSAVLLSRNIKPVIQFDAQRKSAGGGDRLLPTRLTYPTPVQTVLNNYMTVLRYPPAPPPQEYPDTVEQALDPNLDEEARDELVGSVSATVSEDARDVFICALPTLVTDQDGVMGLGTAVQADFIGVVDLRYVGKTGA